jgi:GNAT superfamily N-acetyltransferase
MGHVAAAMATGEGMDCCVEPGWWLTLSGAPSPDVNMVLVHERDEATLGRALDRIAAMRCPALLMLAGDGVALAEAVPAGWDRVGAMPIMSLDVAGAPTRPDPRVRQAGPDDVEVVKELIAEAYGIDRDVVALMTRHIVDGDGTLRTWLLEDDGAAVSTVMTGRVQDSVSLWCMGTPGRFSRRGHGRAILGAVLDWAAADGATTGLLGATPAGLPLYAATGWQVVEEWEIYLNATSAQFSS